MLSCLLGAACAEAPAVRSRWNFQPRSNGRLHYTYGQVLRTQEPGSQPQVLSQLLSGLTASLRFLSGGRPPGMKASFRFSAGSGRGVRGSQLEIGLLKLGLSALQRQPFCKGGWIFYLRAPPPAAPIESVISSGSYKFLRRTEPEVGSLRFLADPDHKAA